jgi:hypothetical protein
MSEHGDAKGRENVTRRSRRDVLALSLAAATFGVAIGAGKAANAEEVKKKPSEEGVKKEKEGSQSARQHIFKIERSAQGEAAKQSKGSQNPKGSSSN